METAVANLPKAANLSFFYCGMNGNNLTIDANDVGLKIAIKNGGNYNTLRKTQNGVIYGGGGDDTIIDTQIQEQLIVELYSK